MNHVHPRLEFIPQKFNPLVLKLAQILLPIILRFRLRRWLIGGIVRIEANNIQELIKFYQQFQVGKVRFLMAFRHSEVEDPLCLFYLMSRIIPQVAHQEKITLKLPIHTHFIYDRGMTIWAGNWLGWLFSRSGGIPIHRGKTIDRKGLRNARDLFINGRFPLTVAPEGATNGHGERVSKLEPGVAQLSFWCLEDLAKNNRSETVFIVPIGIRYYYLTPPWERLNWLLGQLENDTGLTVGIFNKSDPESSLYQRLFQLGEHLLSEMEDFYRRFYNQNIPVANFDISLNSNQRLNARLQTLLDVALKVAEDYFNLPSEGTIIDRCRRLEEAGWKAIYREDIQDLQAISPLQLGLANWIAEEAELRLKPMRLVESFVEVTGSYIQEKPTVERFAETMLILFDLVARIKGKKIPKRPRLGKRRVTITIGKPISVNERWEAYQTNRRAAKQEINNLTQDLQMALEKLIK